jgi:RNA polymerase sigma factor (TIGR02999 family)
MPSEITVLLRRVDQGDRDAADQLFRQVEADLRAIAGKRRQAFPAHLDAPTTLLINEAFCRLLGNPKEAASPADRKMFFRFAATKIHNVLVEMVRREQAQKRGGGRARVEGPEWLEAATGPIDDAELLIDLESALDRFEQFAPEDALLFRIRYFLGCTFEETAKILGVSVSEAKRSFQRSKLWLQQQLRDYADDA